MSTADFPPAETIEDLLRALVVGIFDEHDAAKRAEAISRVFAEDVEFVDPSGIHHGRNNVEGVVAGLHARTPGFRFHLTETLQTQADSGRVSWALGPVGEAPQVTGLDVIRVRDGQITQLITFLDPPPSEPSARG